MKKYIALLGLLILSSNTNAALLQDQQFQTVNGELFTHNLNGPVSDGTGGILTIRARGDFFAGGQFNENYNVSIDGNVLGTALSFDSPGAYDVISHSFDDKEFSYDFAIGSTLMSSVMADLLAIVTVDFGSGMNFFSTNYYSQASLSYNSVSEVPVPAAAFLFAPALLGFMGLRRKAKKA